MRLPNKTDIIKKTAFEKRDYMERVCSADDRIIAALDVDSFEKDGVHRGGAGRTRFVLQGRNGTVLC